MHAAQVRPDGSRIRWVELPGAEPARVYVHGLGASAAPYYATALAHPALSGHRSLMVDLLGFGISDRPADFAYTLEDHADALATAMTEARTGAADVVAHSMGGAVAILLAARHPHLVRRLVLVDANLDPYVPAAPPVGSGLTAYTEAEFLAHGFEKVLDFVGPAWAATMRLAGPLALHRTAVHLARGSKPTMREQLKTLPMPSTYLYPVPGGDVSRETTPDPQPDLTAAGVRVVPVADSGHNIMLDNVDGFARAVAEALA